MQQDSPHRLFRSLTGFSALVGLLCCQLSVLFCSASLTGIGEIRHSWNFALAAFFLGTITLVRYSLEARRGNWRIAPSQMLAMLALVLSIVQLTSFNNGRCFSYGGWMQVETPQHSGEGAGVH